METKHMPGRVSTDAQRQVHCNGHHERRRGIPRADAPRTLREYWLDGWDSADGELYNRALGRPV